LISQENIDGFLVGGAALKPDFLTIIDEANKYPNASA
jgi:triosephosphate isomerase